MMIQCNFTYIVAGRQPWNRRVFDEKISKLPGHWIFISKPEEMYLILQENIQPKYIFFLHWSWIVPSEILYNFECVCFHMTDVPYGRGGSPLQNLIISGIKHTKLTALRMIEDIDAGPVYMKEELCLEGSAEQVYIRSSYLAASMIEKMIRDEPSPLPQEGQVIEFKRRTPDQSLIPKSASVDKLHDFINMLDAENYPKAYLEYGGFRFEFSRSALYNEKLIADVTVTHRDHSKNGK